MTVAAEHNKKLAIRFAGDSGDGMQLMGLQFTNTTAIAGSDVHTFPDYPAEIRAPAGTLAGVSGFQVGFSEQEIHTPGDRLDILVAMNPAALKTNIADLKPGASLIINSDSFQKRDLAKAHYDHNPLDNDDLKAFRVIKVAITDMTVKAVAAIKLSHSQAKKCKNFLALGLVYWLCERDIAPTATWLKQKFKDKPDIAKANLLALQAGYNYADTAELSPHFKVGKAKLNKGLYRQVTGNEAFALGCATATVQSGKQLFLSGYPITPASNLLHYISRYQKFGIKTLQAEDEIAAVCAAIGASFGGQLALTCTSGPGFDLKSEGLGLAMMAELPLVVIDVQRAGPSTGMPTKPEQSDLLTAMFGRHGECPLPIIAPQSPGDCFNTIIEAFQLATKYMTPVIVLSDAYLANGAEPWLIPDAKQLPTITIKQATAANGSSPYARDNKTLARHWAIPGVAGLEHRVGGIEKDSVTGNVSYDPDNHQQMVNLRSQKVQGIVKDIPDLIVEGDANADVLVLSWGSNYGSIRSAMEELQQENKTVAMAHLRHLNPFPANLGDVLQRYKTVVVPELNSGQLAMLLRAQFNVKLESLSKVTGKPFLISEIKEKLLNFI